MFEIPRRYKHVADILRAHSLKGFIVMPFDQVKSITQNGFRKNEEEALEYCLHYLHNIGEVLVLSSLDRLLVVLVFFRFPNECFLMLFGCSLCISDTLARFV
jgi:hypothetical protein